MEYIGPVIPLIVAFWVYSDARNRGKTTKWAFLWFLGVFLVLILFLPLWFIKRPKMKLCDHCGKYYEYGAAYIFCPRCGIELQGGE